VKKYFNDNLSKGFITPIKAPYLSLILFILKANSNLRFYIDYRKLKIIIKRNRYPLLLIEEVNDKIIRYKYLTRLDIIIAFNKLNIDLDSKDFTTFIIGVYKY